MAKKQKKTKSALEPMDTGATAQAGDPGTGVLVAQTEPEVSVAPPEPSTQRGTVDDQTGDGAVQPYQCWRKATETKFTTYEDARTAFDAEAKHAGKRGRVRLRKRAVGFGVVVYEHV